MYLVGYFMKFLYRKSMLVFVFLLVLSVSCFALYPEKESYPYKRDDFGVYLGLGVGPSTSNTFGLAGKESYQGLYYPIKTLSSLIASAKLGLRIWDFRIESEYLKLHQWYSVMNKSGSYHSASLNTGLPTKGQEVLQSLAINLYYDMRFISDNVYPYIGVGIGRGNVKYLIVDEKMQPNGFGEQYHGNKDTLFNHIMFGVQHDMKVIRASVAAEYRLTTMGQVSLTPNNDGTKGADWMSTCANTKPDPKCPGKAESLVGADWKPATSKNVSGLFHSIFFSIKYYL